MGSSGMDGEASQMGRISIDAMRWRNNSNLSVLEIDVGPLFRAGAPVHRPWIQPFDHQGARSRRHRRTQAPAVRGWGRAPIHRRI
jgi:hypothetical protein